MNIYKSIFDRKKLFPFSIYLFSFSLCFNPHWNSKALIILIITSFINVNFNKKYLTNSVFIKVLILLTIYSSINMFLIGDGIHGNSYSLVGLCILFYLIFFETNFRNMNLKNVLFSFSLGVLVVGLINLINIFSHSILDQFSIYNSWEAYSLIDIHKIYYAVYLNMAYAVILYYLYQKELKIGFYLLSLPMIGLLLFITGAVSGLLIFLLINILFAIKKVIPSYFKLLTSITLILPFILLFLLSFNVTQDLFQILDGDGSRIRNFNTNKEIFLNAPLLGNGIGLEMEVMQSARDVKSWEHIKEYNAHNQYFQFLIGGGVVYLILILSIFIPAIYVSLRKDSKYKFLAISYGLIILYVFIIESFLVRHHGLMFFAFFLNLILFLEKNQENNQIKTL